MEFSIIFLFFLNEGFPYRRDMNICILIYYIFILILLFSRLLCCEPAVCQSAAPAAAQGPEVGPEPGGGDDDGPVAGGAPPQLQRLLGPDPPPGTPGAGSWDLVTIPLVPAAQLLGHIAVNISIMNSLHRVCSTCTEDSCGPRCSNNRSWARTMNEDYKRQCSK